MKDEWNAGKIREGWQGESHGLNAHSNASPNRRCAKNWLTVCQADGGINLVERPDGVNIHDRRFPPGAWYVGCWHGCGKERLDGTAMLV